MLTPVHITEIQGGETYLLAPATHDVVMNVPAETTWEQTAQNLKRGLPELTTVAIPSRFRRRVASMCGAGPSLMDNLPALAGDVMAANAAIGALLDAGIVPRYAMIWDATPEMVRYVDLVPGCTWLIASRVHPGVIERLLDFHQDILLWHTATTDPELQAIYGPDRLQVFGGSQAVTRGVFLLGALGYRDLHIFGADSSFTGATHVDGGLRDEAHHEIVAVVEGRPFRTTTWMLLQAQQWVDTILPELIAGGVRVTMHGDGLLPHAHRIWVEKSKPKRWGWIGR